MKLETLKDLYIQELKDLYSAEKQIIKALPKMVKAATNKQLAAGFEEHLKQTKEHATRLEKILTHHDESTRGPKCEGMEGVLKEGEEMIKEDAEEEVRDAGLIAAAQRVEHYEMAGYGCARTYAELLGDPDGAQLLQTDYLDRRIRYRQKAYQVSQFRNQHRTRAKRPKISARPQAQWPINISVARKRYGMIRSIVSALFGTTASNTSARTRRRPSSPRSESVSCSVLYSVVRVGRQRIVTAKSSSASEIYTHGTMVLRSSAIYA
jgi:ferritin-like metal-binding protein YciE